MDKVRARIKEPSTWLAIGVPLVALGILTEGQVQELVVGLGALLSIFGLMPEGQNKEPN